MLSGAEAVKIIRYAAFAEGPVRSLSAFRRMGGALLGWAVAALLVIAGSSYWLGMRSISADRAAGQRHFDIEASPLAQAPLPEPQPSRLEAEASAGSALPPRAAAITPVLDAEQTSPSEPDAGTRSAQVPRSRAATAEAAQKLTGPAADSRSAHPEPANAASGHLVRIGRFATATEAQKGWATILHQWPGMQGLSTAAVPIQSLRDGRTYFRVQVSTTSPAHSEVVCQRARDLDQSCTIIGSEERGGESTI